jgi:hypothetical protein
LVAASAIYYAYAPTKLEYPINRYAMKVNRQLDVLDRRLANNEFVTGDDYNIADMAIWPWFGCLVKGWLYDAAEFLSVQDYLDVVRRAGQIFARPIVVPGRRSIARAARHQRFQYRNARQAYGRTGVNITGKRVLITGGSSGIGLALAQALLAKGAKVANLRSSAENTPTGRRSAASIKNAR